MREDAMSGVTLGRSAFDHPLVKPNSGGMAVGSDRVLLPKDCRCPKCVERLARYEKEYPVEKIKGE